MKKEKMEVSIICNAYNQEKYIKSALEGFVNQKTTFPYEVLIHDDASTDQTANIIRGYEIQYPEIIKPIYGQHNLYQTDFSLLKEKQYGRVRGKYIALCEGDDFWIDPYKLQKQRDALEHHPEIDMCAHAVYKMIRKRRKGKIAPSSFDTVFSPREVINGGGGFVATASLMYRSDMENRLLPFTQIIPLDYAWQIMGSLKGGMLYLSDYMGIRRVSSKGSWTKYMDHHPEKHIHHLEKVNELLECLNVDTRGKYEADIEALMKENQFSIYKLQKNYGMIYSHENKKYYDSLSKKEKIKIFFNYLTRKKDEYK